MLAEKHGLDSFWLGEGYHGRSALALLSAVAVQTKKIQIGTAIIGIYTRHPALIAMESATIDELSHGRFNLGLGVNVTSLVKHGYTKSASTARDQKPYAAMKDAVEIIRKLMTGENTIYNGEIFSLPEPGSALNFHGFKPPRRNMPIYLGSRSPKILELCGAVADGVILSRSLSASGSYVTESLEHLFQGARKAGRKKEDLVVASNLTFSVSKPFSLADAFVRRTSYCELVNHFWSNQFGRSMHPAFLQPSFDRAQILGLHLAVLEHQICSRERRVSYVKSDGLPHMVSCSVTIF